jgi:hypothetical protein
MPAQIPMLWDIRFGYAVTGPNQPATAFSPECALVRGKRSAAPAEIKLAKDRP